VGKQEWLGVGLSWFGDLSVPWLLKDGKFGDDVGGAQKR